MKKYISLDSRIHGDIKEFLDLPISITINDFNESSVKKMTIGISKAQQTRQEILPILIDSYGGDAYALMSMISLLESYEYPVATIVAGKAQSCGAILFAMGTPGYRFMSPHAVLMLHQVSSFLEGKVNETASGQKESERLNDLAYELMAKQCGKPKDYFTELMFSKGNADLFLNAKEAKKHKICDHIRIPSLKTTISVKIELI